jgi:nitroreductase
MDLMDAIYHRRAVREFTDAPVEKQSVEKLISAAIQAPSAMNMQPWAFFVVQDAAVLTEHSRCAKEYLLATLQADSPMERYRERLSDPDFHIFYHAPTLIIVCAKPAGLIPAEDCCLAAQNLMLAAHGMGLGSCWIGFARPWLNLPQTKFDLGISADHTPVAPIVVGYPRLETPPVPREQPEIVWYQARD